MEVFGLRLIPTHLSSSPPPSPPPRPLLLCFIKILPPSWRSFDVISSYWFPSLAPCRKGRQRGVFGPRWLARGSASCSAARGSAVGRFDDGRSEYQPTKIVSEREEGRLRFTFQTPDFLSAAAARCTAARAASPATCRWFVCFAYYNTNINLYVSFFMHM